MCSSVKDSSITAEIVEFVLADIYFILSVNRPISAKALFRAVYN